MPKAHHLGYGWKKLAAGAAFAAGMLASTSAHASVLTTPLSIAAVGAFKASCSPSDGVAGTRLATNANANLVTTKAEAILGGSMSALDRIRQQQAGLQAPQPAPAPEPALTAGADCGTVQMALRIAPELPVAAAPMQPIGDNFLATQRIAIRQTTFTPQWARVSQAELARRDVSALTGIAAARDTTALQAVNRWVNTSIAHAEDRDLWARPDYWASASETLAANRGDCEDFAILKYQMLLALGVAREDMYLTLARDLARNADHAVLIVRMDGQFYMLDNATSAVLPADMSYDYRPTLSFNSESAWLHGAVARPQVTQFAYRSVNATSSPRVIGFSR